MIFFLLIYSFLSGERKVRFVFVAADLVDLVFLSLVQIKNHILIRSDKDQRILEVLLVVHLWNNYLSKSVKRFTQASRTTLKIHWQSFQLTQIRHTAHLKKQRWITSGHMWKIGERFFYQIWLVFYEISFDWFKVTSCSPSLSLRAITTEDEYDFVMLHFYYISTVNITIIILIIIIIIIRVHVAREINEINLLWVYRVTATKGMVPIPFTICLRSVSGISKYIRLTGNAMYQDLWKFLSGCTSESWSANL